jgi:L-seryl-tRNA(Ser) seleniumtransferase
VPPEEPAVGEALAQGADLVCFSGDKLLGGPQAGIVVGRAEHLEKLRKDPMARAVRVDKMQIAALEAVLLAYSRGAQFDLPVWRMLREPAPVVKERADALARALHGGPEGASVEACESAVGGGSLPGFALPSFAVRLKTKGPEAFAAKLRAGDPPVFCRMEEDALIFDMRTVEPAQVTILTKVISYAMANDDGRDEE